MAYIHHGCDHNSITSRTKDNENSIVTLRTEDDEDNIAPRTEDRKDEDKLIEKYIETKVFIIVVEVPVDVESIIRVVVGKRQPIILY